MMVTWHCIDIRCSENVTENHDFSKVLPIVFG